MTEGHLRLQNPGARNPRVLVPGLHAHQDDWLLKIDWSTVMRVWTPGVLAASHDATVPQ